MRYLGLDIGARRVGVAVANSELRLATPLAVIERSTLDEDVRRIQSLVDEYDVESIVVGLPQGLNGSLGAQAQTVMDYVEQLRSQLHLPFEFFDERYSTATALARRRQAGITDKRGRATIDAVAAAVILQDYLDARGSST